MQGLAFLGQRYPSPGRVLGSRGYGHFTRPGCLQSHPARRVSCTGRRRETTEPELLAPGQAPAATPLQPSPFPDPSDPTASAAGRPRPCKPGCRLGVSAPSSPVSPHTATRSPEFLFLFLLRKQFAKKQSKPPCLASPHLPGGGPSPRAAAHFARAALVLQALPWPVALPRLKAAGTRKPQESPQGFVEVFACTISAEDKFPH